MAKLKFVTQYNAVHTPYLHDTGTDDMAIPELTYSIKELREKFALETEVLNAKLRKPGQYFIDSNMDDDEAFDSVSPEIPRDYDFVDADNDREAYRNAVAAMATHKRASKVSRNNSIPPEDTSTGGDSSGAPTTVPIPPTVQPLPQ
ncbi:hypothetical protein [Dipodfec virus UOA04_Rod_975]|nr:hypothetical protein [Dipodfec virus UOA04_Rod_975]